MRPMITTVLDLDAALGGDAGLLLGGGLGLYLKQQHLIETGARTLLPWSSLPAARTTGDIDLFLRAEVIADKACVERYRAALNSLGFVVVSGSEWLKFNRNVQGMTVLLDVMVGPLGQFASGVHMKDSRVRPRDLRGSEGLHAFLTEEALGVEHSAKSLPMTGTLSNGAAHSCEVLIPGAFSYSLMKLGALRDRVNDPDKMEGRHHAMDLYRVVGMLTEEEAAAASELARRFAADPEMAEAMNTIETLLAPRNGIGRLRLLEYRSANSATTPEVDPDWLVSELRRMLSPA